MLAVEAVFQVDLGFPNEVIGAYQIPVIHGHRQHGFHGEAGLDVKGSGAVGLGEGLKVGVRWGGAGGGLGWGSLGRVEVGHQEALLPKDGVELLGDVVLLVTDVSLA